MYKGIKKTTGVIGAFCLFIVYGYGQITPDCSFITDNYSGQITSSRCAPVDLEMEVEYRFMFPVNPSQVEILYIWNDAANTETTVPAVSQGDTIFRASESHNYPPSDQCSYTAEAYVIANGIECTSSSRQEQTFSAWGRDDQNSGVLLIEPPEVQICEGDNIDTIFADQSTFNCNIGIEPDKPNRMIRWVQFIYNTYNTAGNRIPNVSVVDNLGYVYPLTDGSGAFINEQAGPIIPIPMPADGPSQISWRIQAPPGGVDGDIFEITMRNWNICNPYDADPYDTNPPSDTVNGDNAPVITTALIRVITTPAVPTNPDVETCVNEPVILNVSSGHTVRWYSDPSYTSLLHTGSVFNPLNPPVSIDNSVPGTYSFYVTDAIGFCESTPHQVDLTIYDDPTASNAGPNQYICTSTATLQGNTPVTGTGHWTTTGGAIISDPANPASSVTNLDVGSNIFRWTITNGPCESYDEVIIYRDLQPDPADAGSNYNLCNDAYVTLNASDPTNGGIGTWSVLSGGGNIIDNNDPHTLINTILPGETRLIWTVVSVNGGCISSNDTIAIIRDIAPSSAFAGPDTDLCDLSSYTLQGNNITNNGNGTWIVISGGSFVSDIHDPSSNVVSLAYGDNQLEWLIESEFGICSATRDTVVITRFEMPLSAAAGSDQEHCLAYSSNPLGANTPSVGTGEWNILFNPSGINPVFIPSDNDPNATLNILSGNEGEYILTWTIRNGSCITGDTVSVDFGIPLPPAYAGPDTSVCGLSVYLKADNPPIGQGTWQVISGAGSVSFSDIHDPNALIQISTGNEGSYLLEWQTLSGSCLPLPVHLDTVQIDFKPSPSIPVAYDQDRCGNGVVTLESLKAYNATTCRWYDSISNGNLLHTDTLFTTPALNSTQTYYVSAYNDTSMCESSRIPVDAIINLIPDLAITQNEQNCGSDSVQLSALTGANGLNTRWYNSLSDISPITAGNNFTTPVLSQSRSYWVTSYNDSTLCESAKTEVEIIIDSIPHAPVISDTARCGSGNFELQAVTGIYGTTNRWYDQETGGTLFATSDSYITNFLTSTTSFYVSSYNNITQCESKRYELTAVINPIPGNPVVEDTSICGYDTLLLSGTVGTGGNTLRWYNMPGGNNILAVSVQFETSYLTSTTSYWISTFNSVTGCESPREHMEVEVKELPQTTPIQGYDFVRQDQTNVIYSVDYHTGSDYYWVIPAEVNKINEVDNFVILGFPNLGNQTITVQETAQNGCTGPVVEKTIVVTNDIISLIIENNSIETCYNDNTILNVVPQGGNAPYFYEWSGNISHLSDTDISNPIFYANNTGTFNYGIHVWDIDGNHAYDTIEVKVNPNPLVVFAPDEITVCAGSDYNLDPSITSGSGLYTLFMWTGNTMGLSHVNIANPVFNTSYKTNYEMVLTVRDSRACMGRDTVMVHNILPSASFTSDALPKCSPATFSFENTSVDATHFEWDFDDNSSSNDTNTNHTYYNLGNSVEYFEVKLTAYDDFSCSSTTSAYVTLYPNPDHNFTVTPQTGCDPVHAVLTSNPGGFLYSWDFGDGTTETGNYSTFHEYTNNLQEPVSYNITLIATSFFGCTDTFTNSIEILPSPKPYFIATPESQMYPDAIVYISNVTQSDAFEYYWNFGDDEYSENSNPATHEYLYPGNYEIMLKMTGTYCSDSIIKRITILPHPPIAKFKPVDPGCMPHTVQFENQSSYADTYLWEFGDGAISNKPNPQYTYYESGVYKVKLTASNKEGLRNEASDVSTVYVLPNAFFDLAPKIVFINEEDVHFFNLSDNGDIYEWNFGDGETSAEFEPQHMYSSAGTYDVTLKVWTDDGCFDLYDLKSAVVVEESGKIVFPNVIKPGSAIDQNKTFRPAVIDKVEDYHLMIYNRWGELIFESNSEDIGWDGCFDGKPVKSDVYMWKLTGKYENGRAINETGDVTVLY